MKIVIVEDELMVAKRLKMFCESILEEKLTSLKHFFTLEDAQEHLDENTIDLLLLDLNLNNKDGFELLKNKLASSYHTIIVSANSDRAIEAFEYGVLDFIAKPFKKERVAQALARLTDDNAHTKNTTKYLSIKHYGGIEIIKTEDIDFIQASHHYSEIHLLNGETKLHEKNLEKLLETLPTHFARVHKSYLLNLNRVKKLHKLPGSQYQLELGSGQVVPLGRTRYVEIKGKLCR